MLHSEIQSQNKEQTPPRHTAMGGVGAGEEGRREEGEERET